ncbi:MAG TPA: co-chaperone YbbN [Burkholderiales bacterium]|nr:co-chaperone YbbN [Burkholderiales bacterium]
MAIDVTTGDFQAAVIEGSRRTPVIVDFWAPWCAPCRALAPVLEKLETEYEGRFALARVNSDENPELAARHGVRGIPHVKAFVDGEIVDEFSGALPEPAVREFLNRVIPTPAEELRAQALALYRTDGDAAQALNRLEHALALEPQNPRVLADAAAVMADLARYEEAKRTLERLPALAQMEEPIAALRARIDFAIASADAPQRAVLEQRVREAPADLEARLKLAYRCVTDKDYAAALDQLLEIVRRDRAFRDDIGRKTMLEVFGMLGKRGALVDEYRRRLASAMY